SSSKGVTRIGKTPCMVLACSQRRLPIGGHEVVLNIVRDNFVAESWCGGQGNEPVGIDSVTRAAQVGMWRVIVHTRRQQSLLVVLAGIFAGRAQHLEVAEAGHMDFTPY